jgi:hypothetical protein
MNKIIGRQEEQRELTEIFNSKKAEFVVVYGRRRIGKTFLIEHFFKTKKCLYFHVTGVQDGLLKEQLTEFAKAIGKTFYSGATIASATTWMKAFDELNNAIDNLAKSQKIIIFMDELPWMATKRSRILQALDYYWNYYWSKNKNLKLVICGSSASWIIKNIIYNKGGLHNRYTSSLLIKPFSLYESNEFLKSRNIKISDKQLLQLYMTIGGVPHYLDRIKKGLSAAQNIEQLCFRETGILFSEFEKLFKSLFDDAKVYIELIRIISKLREGVSRAYIEENSKLSTKGGTLTDRLNDLEQAGFIKSFLPFKHQRQGVYYRIIDEYTYFYLKWIEPEKQALYSNDSGHWLYKTNSPIYYSWMGYSFESVCYKHIAQIQKALNIPSGSKAGTWRYSPKRGSKDNGAQIDLLFERNDDAVTICEIKCTNEPFTIDKNYYHLIMNKVSIYQKITKTSKQIFIAFISANGIKKSTYTDNITGVVTLDDLLKG